MEEERSHFKYYIVKLCLFVVLAVLVIIFREQNVTHLKYFIGGLMLLYGLEEILFEILHSRKHIFHQDKLYLGFIELVLGVCLLTIKISYEGVCVIWATWSILRESYEIKEVMTELKCLVPKIISGLESLVVIVFSILLICEPTEHHALIHLYLLMVELPLSPLTPLLDELLVHHKSKQNEKERDNQSQD